eukprot:TRINITY_DN3850_c0_g2_i1.p1 TRINITY_DN3850_c0_g2~~TRINITY_DN3850_c0_g2_i1.p1  ORF type:complete len:179 (-),score=21.65 TRINITY_DN3850_c0_g2_i1:28-564(-)
MAFALVAKKKRPPAIARFCEQWAVTRDVPHEKHAPSPTASLLNSPPTPHRNNQMDDLTILVSCAAFGLMGVGSLVNPDLVLGQFGVRGITRAARNEVRAVYGGFGLAMSGALLLAWSDTATRAPICLTVALALAGMAAGRVLALAIDRKIDALPTLYLAIETGFAACLFRVAKSAGLL